MASYYDEFIKKWDREGQNSVGFFGLRDFYSYIKYVCQNINGEEMNERIISEVIFQSVMINFDGQPESLKVFFECANMENLSVKALDPL